MLTWAVAFMLLASELASAPGGSKADAFAKAILASSSNVEVESRLHQVDPNLPDRSWVLPVLFESVSGGTATDDHWAALCRVDSWGDGAWHLEIKGSAFDAFAKNPSPFIGRYLKGDDCALLMITYAYQWLLEAPEVGGLDCADHGEAELKRFDQAVHSGVQTVIGAKRPDTPVGRIRHDSLLQLVSFYQSAWPSVRDRVQESCEDEAK